MMKNITKLALSGIPLLLIGCAPATHLTTPTGKPEIAIRDANWKTASVAIAEYNLSNGRKLDQVSADEIVLYEAVASSDGTEQITSKTVYVLVPTHDSVIIFSHRYFTDDLDDSNVSEADDQATYDAEQQELSAIAGRIAANAGPQAIAEPASSR